VESVEIEGPHDARLYGVMWRQPISRVVWRRLDTLRLGAALDDPAPVPSVVEAMVVSLLQHGFLHAIVVDRDLTIVDGKVRWWAARDDRVLALFDGYVPTVVVVVVGG